MQTKTYSEASKKAIVIERKIQNLLDKINDPFAGPTERKLLSKTIASYVNEMRKLVP